MPLVRLESSGQPGGFNLIGELDVSNVEHVASRLMFELRGGQDVVLDTSGLTFMDSQGLRLLIKLGQQAQESGQTVRVVNCSPAVQRILDVAVPGGIRGVEMQKKA